MDGRVWVAISVGATLLAAYLTLSALGWVWWLSQPDVSGDPFWQDLQTWSHLAVNAVPAAVMWTVAYLAWHRQALTA